MEKSEAIAEEYLRKVWAMYVVERKFREYDKTDDGWIAEFKAEDKRIKAKEAQIKKGLAKQHGMSVEEFHALLIAEQANQGGVSGTKFYDLVSSLRAHAEQREAKKREMERKRLIEELGYDPNPEPPLIPLGWKIALIVIPVLFLGTCIYQNHIASDYMSCIEMFRNGSISDPSIC